MNEIAKLPSVIQDHIYEYYHPYKTFFTNKIINKHEIWKSSWIFWYNNLTNPIHKMVGYYLLCKFKIFYNKEIFIEEYDQEFIQCTYYPTDIIINTKVNDIYTKYECIDVYVYLFVPTSIHIFSNIIFIGLIMKSKYLKKYWEEIILNTQFSRYIQVYENIQDDIVLYKHINMGWGPRVTIDNIS